MKEVIQQINLEGVKDPSSEFSEVEKSTQYNPIDTDDVVELAKKYNLNIQEVMFVKYFMRLGNANQAYKLSHKSRNSRARLLLQNPNIKKLIQDITAEKFEEVNVDILNLLQATIQAKITDFVEIYETEHTTKSGKTYTNQQILLKDLANMKEKIDDIVDENGNPIEVEDKRLWAIKNITPTENGKLRIELYDRMEAIKLLHKIQQGDIPQKIEISTVEARESILEKLAKLTGNAGDKNEKK